MIRVGKKLIAEEAITEIDTSRIEKLEVTVRAPSLVETVRDGDAVDLVMRLQPSLLEGPRLRFARHAWAIHNLVGHPLLQICAWLGRPKLGLFIHDVTIPRPRRS